MSTVDFHIERLNSRNKDKAKPSQSRLLQTSSLGSRAGSLPSLRAKLSRDRFASTAPTSLNAYQREEPQPQRPEPQLTFKAPKKEQILTPAQRVSLGLVVAPSPCCLGMLFVSTRVLTQITATGRQTLFAQVEKMSKSWVRQQVSCVSKHV